jgi:hypothetical protein
MNAGKKLIRNTVFALWGTAALFIGLNRLQSRESTAGGSSFLALGLRQEREPEPKPQIDLAAARDFTRLSVRGPLSVQIVGASAFKVWLEPVAGYSPKVRAWLNEGVLHVDGGEEQGRQAVLHVEVPTLQRVDAANAEVAVRGLSTREFSLYTYGGGVARLEQNSVQHWHLFSSRPLDLRVDDATFAAGTIKTTGDVVVRRSP